MNKRRQYHQLDSAYRWVNGFQCECEPEDFCTCGYREHWSDFHSFLLTLDRDVVDIYFQNSEREPGYRWVSPMRQWKFQNRKFNLHVDRVIGQGGEKGNES